MLSSSLLGAIASALLLNPLLTQGAPVGSQKTSVASSLPLRHEDSGSLGSNDDPAQWRAKWEERRKIGEFINTLSDDQVIDFVLQMDKTKGTGVIDRGLKQILDSWVKDGKITSDDAKTFEAKLSPSDKIEWVITTSQFYNLHIILGGFNRIISSWPQGNGNALNEMMEVAKRPSLRGPGLVKPGDVWN